MEKKPIVQVIFWRWNINHITGTYSKTFNILSTDYNYLHLINESENTHFFLFNIEVCSRNEKNKVQRDQFVTFIDELNKQILKEVPNSSLEYKFHRSHPNTINDNIAIPAGFGRQFFSDGNPADLYSKLKILENDIINYYSDANNNSL